jgi:hypothetical protein
LRSFPQFAQVNANALLLSAIGRSSKRLIVRDAPARRNWKYCPMNIGDRALSHPQQAENG